MTELSNKTGYTRNNCMWDNKYNYKMFFRYGNKEDDIMKKKLMRLCSIVLVISMVLGNAVSVSADTENAEATGMTFSPYLKGVVNEVFDSDVKTVEATVLIPSGLSSYSGIILGMYGANSTPCLSFELYTAGYPCVYYQHPGSTTATRLLFKSTIPKDVKTHLTFVLDEVDGETNISCYVNGIKQDVHASETYNKQPGVIVQKPSVAYCVGGDYRTNPTNSYFKGDIYSVATYSDVRTENEIAGDVSNVDTTDAELIAYYDLTNTNESTTKVDNGSASDTNNKYALNIIETWMDVRRPVLNEEDAAYSIALVGDTQIATEYDVYNDKKVVAGIYEWLLENKDEKNIEFVIGLGDIVQGESTYTFDTSLTKGEDAQRAEWEYAMEQIHTLDGEIPYSLIRGNHDSQAMYNEYVTKAGHGNVINGSLDSTMLNTWQELVVGDIKYLILSLDLGASDTELAWAEEVIKTHPNHNVIISTHAYLNEDGTTLDANDAFYPSQYPSSAYPTNRNNGDEMWNDYFTKYDNVVMIVSGHIGSEDIIYSQATGDNNNKVAQLLVDPQDLDNKLVKAGDTPTGMICLLNFSADGKTVQVEQYSTANGQWYMSTSQMTFDMNVITNANKSLLFDRAQQMKDGITSTTTRQFEYNASHNATVNSQIILSAGYTNVISYCAPSDGLIKITDLEVGYYAGSASSATKRVVEFAVTDENGRILTNRGDVLTLDTTDGIYSYDGLAMETMKVEQGDCIYFVFHGVTTNTNLIYCYPNIQLSTDGGNNWTTVSSSSPHYRVPWPSNTGTYSSTTYSQGMGGFYYQYSTTYEKVDYQKPEYLYINPQNMTGYRTNANQDGTRYVDFPFSSTTNHCMTSYNQIIASAGYTNVIAYESPSDGVICIDAMNVWIVNSGTGRTSSFAVVDETGRILSNNGNIYTFDSYNSETDAIAAADNLSISKHKVEAGERIYFVFHGIAGTTNVMRCNAQILFSAEGGNTFTQKNIDAPWSSMTLYSELNYVTDKTVATIDPSTYQGKGGFYYQYSAPNTSDVDGIQVGDKTEGFVTIYEAPKKNESYCDKHITEVATDGSVSYVDLDMLNVKMQAKVHKDESQNDTDLTDIRFIASVDHLSYQKVGFLFTKDETIAEDANSFVVGTIPPKANRHTTKVYTMMLASGIYRRASDIYANDGCNTAYAYAFEMTSIPKNDGTIYVRAYVLLDDGVTYVYGEPRAINVTAAGTAN